MSELKCSCCDTPIHVTIDTPREPTPEELAANPSLRLVVTRNRFDVKMVESTAERTTSAD